MVLALTLTLACVMYPYLGSMSVFGITIVIWIAIVCFRIWKNTDTTGVSRRPFFASLGIYIAVPFLLGTYSYYLLEKGILVPLYRKQILLYISPYGFHAHMIGVVLGMVIIGWMILRRTIGVHQQQFWLSTLFDAMSLANIVIGVLLVVSDEFFGVGVSSWGTVNALSLESKWTAFEYIIPLGVYFSLISIAMYASVLSLRKKQIFGCEYLGRAGWSFMMGVLTLRQQYPRHLVTEVFGKTFDIKQYFFLGLCFFFLFCFASFQTKWKKSFIVE